jgi:glycosyltransferase involved in cell wall biosynthesis
MEKKLYIINNGLKDLRGHYFETAVSIAEASGQLGLRPVLAANVTCPNDIVPDGMEFHPVFTTDHWVSHEPPRQLDVHGLRGELAPFLASPIEALRDGTIDFDQYLRARFLLTDDDEQLREEVAAAPATRAESVSQAVPPSRRQTVKRFVKALMPPVLQGMIPVSRMILRQVLPPLVWNGLRRVLKPEPVAAIPEMHEAVIPPQPSASPAPEEEKPAPLLDRLKMQLEQIGAPQEFGYFLRFQQDLERLLTFTGCAPCDHVFLPTAHGRELCAIVQLLEALPIESQPTFHLEFRHALDMDGPDTRRDEEHPYCALHRVFFEHARLFPASDRLRLYTDTEALSEEFERASGLEFGVLPIPFRARLISRPAGDHGPICIAFFGDVREEKGFHWLPDLIDAMMDEYLARGRARFLIQASLVHPEANPRSRAALERLKTYAEDHVQLVGLEGPLAPERYYQLVSEADLLLCPYHPGTYRARSSGTLTEAIAAGIPTVVPRGTWLARAQPPGSGETFDDRESFIEAVLQVCGRYAGYQQRAVAGRRGWQARHSPERLIRALLGEGECEPSGSRVGKVA